MTERMVLCGSYAVSGTDRAYGATVLAVPLTKHLLHQGTTRYAMSGTDLGRASPYVSTRGCLSPYARTTPCPVLR
eukprot:2276834-Rhodomonas_salina.3